MTPACLPQPLEAAGPHVVLVGTSVPIGEVREFHWREGAINDHGRTEAGAEPEVEHPPALIAAQSLQRRVVDDPRGTPQGLLEIETHPSATQVVRLGHRPAVRDHSGIADRDDIIPPVGRHPSDRRHHRVGCHLRAGGELTRRPLTGRQHLHVRATDVDHEDAATGRVRAGQHTGSSHSRVPVVSCRARSGPQLPGS